MRRTCLSIPANSSKMLAKGADSPADSVVLDLEDSVPLSEKEKAREQMREALASLDFRGKERAVRVNGLSTPLTLTDITQAVAGGADAIVLAKTESREDIVFVERVLTQVEKDIGANRTTAIHALIETARGVQAVDEISRASRRLTALIFGSADYFADIGAQAPVGSEEAAAIVLYPRCRIVIAAAAAGIDSIDSVFPDFRDSDGLKIDAQRGARMGFKGKWVIHPAQIEIVNQAYTPTLEQFRSARRMIEAYEKAKQAGRGAIAIGDRMVDEANIVLARKQCDMARQLGVWDKLSGEV